MDALEVFTKHLCQAVTDIRQMERKLATAQDKDTQFKAQIQLHKLRHLERGLERAIAAEKARRAESIANTK